MAVKTPLWTPSEEKIRNANITRFMGEVNKRFGKNFKTYDELYQWSVDCIPDFWATFWDFAGIIHSKGYETVVDDPYKMPGAQWFIGAELNFAENLLRHRDARFHRAAGTAGRHGYPERRRVRPTPSAWRALWGCAAAQIGRAHV